MEIGPMLSSQSFFRWARKVLCVLIYLGILALCLFVIEVRVDEPVWRNGKISERIPLFVAIFNWVFHPERMQYVATSDMKMNHQLLRSDFTFPMKSEALCNYFPRIDDIKGKYLKKDITAGRAIYLKDLSPVPVIDPQPDTYTVNIRLSKQGSPKHFLEPQSVVLITPLDAGDKLQGIVLSSTWEIVPSPSPTQAIEKQTSATVASPDQTVPSVEANPPPND
jgi:hypothetical protein